MKWLLNPVGLVFLAVAGIGAFFGRAEAVALGIGGYIIMLAASAMRSSAEVRRTQPADMVSNENRSRILPLARLAREVSEIAAKYAENPVVKVMGPQAKSDADRILEQSVRLLNLRDDLRKALASQERLEQSIEQLRSSSEAATAVPQKEMLDAAISARETELRQIERAKEGLMTVDAHLVQAEAALSELRTRLQLAAAGSAEVDADNMRETITNLEAISASIDEAETIMRGIG